MRFIFHYSFAKSKNKNIDINRLIKYNDDGNDDDNNGDNGCSFLIKYARYWRVGQRSKLFLIRSPQVHRMTWRKSQKLYILKSHNTE